MHKSMVFEIKEATITNVNEVQSAIDVLATQCDAVFAPNDNTIASANEHCQSFMYSITSSHFM